MDQATNNQKKFRHVAVYFSESEFDRYGAFLDSKRYGVQKGPYLKRLLEQDMEKEGIKLQDE